MTESERHVSGAGQVLERSKTNKEIGAAITLGPNAINILTPLGFDLVRSRAVPTDGVRTGFRFSSSASVAMRPQLATCFIDINLNRQFQIRNADTGDITFTMVDDWHTRFGQPWVSLHRVDLHNELKLLATDPNISNTKPALLRTGVDIVDIVRIVLPLFDSLPISHN